MYLPKNGVDLGGTWAAVKLTEIGTWFVEGRLLNPDAGVTNEAKSIWESELKIISMLFNEMSSSTGLETKLLIISIGSTSKRTVGENTD